VLAFGSSIDQEILDVDGFDRWMVQMLGGLRAGAATRFPLKRFGELGNLSHLVREAMFGRPRRKRREFRLRDTRPAAAGDLAGDCSEEGLTDPRRAI